MIFVTVGTHEQPFDRLIEYMDNIKRTGQIGEEVIIQTGYCTYEPQCCTWQKFYPYPQMVSLVDEARIVITHGGPSSFMMPLQAGKTPIVVPRQKKYGEHVNDHQVEFTRKVAQRKGNVIAIIDLEDLKGAILHYDAIINDMRGNTSSNNARFNADLEKIVDKLMNGAG